MTYNTLSEVTEAIIDLSTIDPTKEYFIVMYYNNLGYTIIDHQRPWDGQSTIFACYQSGRKVSKSPTPSVRKPRLSSFEQAVQDAVSHCRNQKETTILKDEDGDIRYFYFYAMTNVVMEHDSNNQFMQAHTA